MINDLYYLFGKLKYFIFQSWIKYFLYLLNNIIAELYLIYYFRKVKTKYYLNIK